MGGEPEKFQVILEFNEADRENVAPLLENFKQLVINRKNIPFELTTSLRRYLVNDPSFKSGVFSLKAAMTLSNKMLEDLDILERLFKIDLQKKVSNLKRNEVLQFPIHDGVVDYQYGDEPFYRFMIVSVFMTYNRITGEMSDAQKENAILAIHTMVKAYQPLNINTDGRLMALTGYIANYAGLLKHEVNINPTERSAGNIKEQLKDRVRYIIDKAG